MTDKPLPETAKRYFESDETHKFFAECATPGEPISSYVHVIQSDGQPTLQYVSVYSWGLFEVMLKGRVVTSFCLPIASIHLVQVVHGPAFTRVLVFHSAGEPWQFGSAIESQVAELRELGGSIQRCLRREAR